MQITAALDAFILQLQADGRSNHTVLQYRRHVRLLARWAADVGHCATIEDLTHQDLARFLTAPMARVRPDGEQKKATSVNALRSSLRCFFGYLHEAGEIRVNPARLIRRARCSPPPPRGIPESDLEKLLATIAKDTTRAGKRDFVMFSLMAATGIRLGSAVGLDVEDVDLERGELLVRTGKGGQQMMAYIEGAMRRLLAEHIARMTTGPLFIARGGRRISNRQVQRRFASWLRIAETLRRLGVHSLRHAFAIKAYAQSRDLLAVGEALGHQSIASTVVYAQATARALRIALVS